MTHTEIVEVSPRDGLQNDPTPVGTADKIELIRRAVAAGVTRVEVTSFVNPKRVPQMADADAVMQGVPRERGVSYIGLALNERGAERAIAAGVDEINYVVVASDTFSRRNQGAPTAEILAQWPAVRARAVEAGVRTSVGIGASFGCPFEGVVPPERVVALVEALMASGLDEIGLADTIGVGVPRQVTDLVARVRAVVPETPVRCHFHNTRNTGLANALAAVEAGARVLDASIGGVGGCPFAPAATGNIATEDLVYLLRGMGHDTGLDLERLIDTARWLEGILGHAIPGMLSKAGDFPATLAA